MSKKCDMNQFFNELVKLFLRMPIANKVYSHIHNKEGGGLNEYSDWVNSTGDLCGNVREPRVLKIR